MDVLEKARALLAEEAEVMHLRERLERDPVLGLVTVDDSVDMLPLLAGLVAEIEAARVVVERARRVHEQSNTADQCLWSWKDLATAIGRYDAARGKEG